MDRCLSVLVALVGLGGVAACHGETSSGASAPAQTSRPTRAVAEASTRASGQASHEPAGSETTSGAEPAGPATPAVVLMPPGRDPVHVRVEVVRTPSDRRRGLMFREHLDADAGMLFLFERPQQLSFWMRNTLIPLDMIFIEPDMTVLGVVENAAPRTETARSVPGRSQFVLEVNAGFARVHGIGAGTPVRFEHVARMEVAR